MVQYRFSSNYLTFGEKLNAKTSYFASYSRVSKRHPELGSLIVWIVGMMVLAAFYDVSLVLIAVCFSTWLVLPWAYYESLIEKRLDANNAEDEDRANEITDTITQMREGQAYLFVAGFFFLVYILLRILDGIPSTNPIVIPYLYVMKDLMFIFGFVFMSQGFIRAARVVNTVTELHEEIDN